MDPTRLNKSFLTTIICLPKDVVYRILSFCGLDQILAMNGACWLTRALVRFYTRRVWSFDLRFKIWFHDVRGFQRLLRRYQAVVSGSLAFQFFHRVHYPESNMDIYVHHTNVRHVAQWIAGEGYILASGTGRSDIRKCIRSNSFNAYQRGSHGTSITVIINYSKDEVFWDGTIRCRRIRVIAVEVHPVHHILDEFHLTGVMNFISATIAVSLFPRSTFLHRKVAVLRGTSQQSQEWLGKYRARGFDVVREGKELMALDGVGDRNVLDCYSWKIRFDVPKLLARRRNTEERFLKLGFRLDNVHKPRVDPGAHAALLRISRPISESSDDSGYMSDDLKVD